VFSTRKGDPAPQFLTNRGRETLFWRPSASPPRYHLGLWRDRKIYTTGPSKPLGYYPSKRTRCNIPAWHSNNPARSQHWRQNTPKAQARAMIPIQTFKLPRNRHKHTNAARQRVRSEAQADVVRILDSPSPPPRTGLTTHATPRAEHHIHAPAEMAGRYPELSP